MVEMKGNKFSCQSAKTGCLSYVQGQKPTPNDANQQRAYLLRRKTPGAKEQSPHPVSDAPCLSSFRQYQEVDL